jgi:CRP/FNR family transcriptional regulator
MSALRAGELAEVLACYPSLTALPAEVHESLAREATWIDAAAETTVFAEASRCRGFPLVLSGAVRVSRRSRSGRSVELYRVLPGEVCLFSANALLAGGILAASGQTLAPTRMVVLSPGLFERMTAHPPFGRFVLDVFGQRLAELIAVVDALAFQSIEQRLAGFLLGQGRVLHTTHQQIAAQLGTVREIVTRQLNRFEAAGLIRLGREQIEILQAPGLRILASADETAVGATRTES